MSLLSVQLNPLLILVTARFQGSWTAGDILELLQSPPLRQQLDAFTHVSYSYPSFLFLLHIYVPDGVSRVTLIMMFACFAGAADWPNRSCSVWSGP